MVDWQSPLFKTKNFDICLVSVDQKFAEAQTFWLGHISPVFDQLIKEKCLLKDEADHRSYLEVDCTGAQLQLLMCWMDPTVNWSLNDCTTFEEFVGLATLAERYEIRSLEKHLDEELVVLVRANSGPLPLRYWGISIHFDYGTAKEEIQRRLAAQPLLWDLGGNYTNEIEWIPSRQLIGLLNQMRRPSQPLELSLRLPSTSSKATSQCVSMDAPVDWSDTNIAYRTCSPDLHIIAGDRKILELHEGSLFLSSPKLYELMVASHKTDEETGRRLFYLPESSDKLVLLLKWMYPDSDRGLGKATIEDLGALAEIARKYGVVSLAEQTERSLINRIEIDSTDALYIWSLALQYKYQMLLSVVEDMLQRSSEVFGFLADSARFPLERLEPLALVRLLNYWRVKLSALQRRPLT